MGSKQAKNSHAQVKGESIPPAGQAQVSLDGHPTVPGEAEGSCSIDSAHSNSPNNLRISCKFSSVSSLEKATENSEAN